jgi:hypothetical protein
MPWGHMPSRVVCSIPPGDRGPGQRVAGVVHCVEPERTQVVGGVVGRRAPGPVSQSRSMSSWSNGAIGLRPERRSRKYSSSTQARCLSRPPSITDDTPSRRRSPSVHFSTLPREGTPVAFQPCHGRRYLVAAHEALDVPLWRLSGREAQGARHDGPPQALSERGTYRTPIRYSADPLRPRDLFHPSASGCRQTPWGYLVRGVARRPSR